MAKPIAIRKTELTTTVVPDENYPIEDGRTRNVYSYEYVPITSKPYPLKKKYR